MQLRIVNPGEVLPALLEDVELCGPDDMPRIWPEPGPNPPNLPKVSPKVANLRHVVMRNLHDVSAIWSHPTETPVDIRAGLEWDDVYSDLHGWHCPDDPTRPDGNHGHDGYFQTDERFGVRTIRRCIFGRSFATSGKVYAESNNVDGATQYSKTANYVIEDCVFFGGSFLIGNFGAGNRDAVNVTVRRCVFIDSDLTVGYNGHSCQNNVIEDCTIFGTLTVKAGANITVRNNTIITEGPYRTPGYLYDNGSGAVSVVFGAAANYSNPVFENNLLYTDGPASAFNGRSRAQSLSGGGMVTGTQVVGGVDDFPAFQRCIDIPERQAAWLAVYNPSGASTIPLGDYKRVRDVRRWHSSYVSNELVMSGEPDAPMNWPPEYGAPPIAPNLLPTFLIARLETVSQEETILALSTDLQAAVDTITALVPQVAALEQQVIDLTTANDALTTANAALTAQVADLSGQLDTVTQERDAANAKLAVFYGASTSFLPQIQAFVAAVTPVLPAA